jgi:hypothetical protein
MLLYSSSSVPVAHSYDCCNDLLGSINGKDVFFNSWLLDTKKGLLHGVSSVLRCIIITPICSTIKLLSFLELLYWGIGQNIGNVSILKIYIKVNVLPPPSPSYIRRHMWLTITISFFFLQELSCCLCPVHFASSVDKLGYCSAYRIQSPQVGVEEREGARNSVYVTWEEKLWFPDQIILWEFKCQILRYIMSITV